MLLQRSNHSTRQGTHAQESVTGRQTGHGRTTRELMDKKLEELEQAIVEAEEAKRQFVRDNPNGTGNKEDRMRLYNDVERARRALRDYKRMNPHLL